MTQDLQIRKSCPKDLPAIKEMYESAFPEEDLVPLVNELLDNRDDVLSLVGIRDDALVAHVAFTICDIENSPHKAALLAPLCVDPSHQKTGIGTTIVKEGLEQIKAQQIICALTLGDPAYYGRFGFTPEKQISAPYLIPKEWAEAWQSIQLDKNAKPPSGNLDVPTPWHHKELWS